MHAPDDNGCGDVTEDQERNGPAPSWDDDYWLEARDTEWRRGCRWLQSCWRETELGLPAGPHRPPTPGKEPRRTRPVASTLPLDVDWSVNYLTPEAATAAERLVETHAGGLVDNDRLRRNLLSSQPVCINPVRAPGPSS
jgi:hypothetical protein